VFAGTWRSRLIDTDAFKETVHTRCAIYLWEALQTHIILHGKIEFVFIAHPEVSSLMVEHLTQTRVPLGMHEALKTEMIGLKAKVKASVITANPNSQATEFAKLQQDVRVAIKSLNF
jgi:hypothetical protein